VLHTKKQSNYSKKQNTQIVQGTSTNETHQAFDEKTAIKDEFRVRKIWAARLNKKKKLTR